MKHSQYLENWKSTLVDLQEVDLGLDPKIVKLYKGFVQNHYHESIKKMFPRLKRVDLEIFKLILDSYFKEHPPLEWELNSLCKGVTNFLETKDVNRACIDLVKYELAEFFVYRILSKQKDQDYIQVNDCHELLELEFKIAEWIKISEKNGTQIQFNPKQEKNLLMISRNLRTDLCVMTSIGAIDYLLFTLAQEENLGQHDLVKRCGQELEKLQLGSTVSAQDIKTRVEFLKQQFIFI